MKNVYLIAGACLVFASCSESAEPKMAEETKVSAAPGDLPFTASYSANWSADVADADLKTVLKSYKDWADANMAGLENSLADTVTIDQWDGKRLKLAKADVIKMWSSHRDSISAVKIDMVSWHKMYNTDKKEGYIVTWYDEWDTYKSGRTDSASWHDINQVKDGKIVWYSQYRRPKQ